MVRKVVCKYARWLGRGQALIFWRSGRNRCASRKIVNEKRARASFPQPSAGESLELQERLHPPHKPGAVEERVEHVKARRSRVQAMGEDRTRSVPSVLVLVLLLRLRRTSDTQKHEDKCSVYMVPSPMTFYHFCSCCCCSRSKERSASASVSTR